MRKVNPAKKIRAIRQAVADCEPNGLVPRYLYCHIRDASFWFSVVQKEGWEFDVIGDVSCPPASVYLADYPFDGEEYTDDENRKVYRRRGLLTGESL